MTQFSKKYDLEERLARFGENVIDLCKVIEQNIITRPIISQLIRSAVSIGANYMEANGAISKRDFSNKIHISKKEAQETKHLLRMLLRCVPNHAEKISILSDECRQLVLIFQSITMKIKEKEKV